MSKPTNTRVPTSENNHQQSFPIATTPTNISTYTILDDCHINSMERELKECVFFFKEKKSVLEKSQSVFRNDTASGSKVEGWIPVFLMQTQALSMIAHRLNSALHCSAEGSMVILDQRGWGGGSGGLGGWGEETAMIEAHLNPPLAIY